MTSEITEQMCKIARGDGVNISWGFFFFLSLSYSKNVLFFFFFCRNAFTAVMSEEESRSCGRKEVDRWEKSEKLKTVQRRLHQQVLIPPPTHHHHLQVCCSAPLCYRFASLWSLSEDVICLPPPLVSCLGFDIYVFQWFLSSRLGGRKAVLLFKPAHQRLHNIQLQWFILQTSVQVPIYWGFHPSSSAWLQLGVSLWQHQKRFVWELSLDQPILICHS